MTNETIKNSINRINDMILMAKTDTSIDVKDLEKERRNAYKALKKLSK